MSMNEIISSNSESITKRINPWSLGPFPFAIFDGVTKQKPLTSPFLNFYNPAYDCIIERFSAGIVGGGGSSEVGVRLLVTNDAQIKGVFSMYLPIFNSVMHLEGDIIVPDLRYSPFTIAFDDRWAMPLPLQPAEYVSQPVRFKTGDNVVIQVYNTSGAGAKLSILVSGYYVPKQ